MPEPRTINAGNRCKKAFILPKNLTVSTTNFAITAAEAILIKFGIGY